jgi:hypothetical protein
MQTGPAIPRPLQAVGRADVLSQSLPSGVASKVSSPMSSPRKISSISGRGPKTRRVDLFIAHDGTQIIFLSFGGPAFSGS